MARAAFGRYAVVVSLVYCILRWSIPSRLLTGLEAWGVQKPKDGDTGPAKPATKGSQGPQTSAERSKAAKHKSVGQRAAKREFKAPGADSLIAQRLTSKEVCQADYYHLAELMVTATLMAVAVTAIEVVRAVAEHTSMAFIPAGLAVGAVVISFWSLLQVDVLSRVVPVADRYYVAGIAGTALIVAALGLLYIPQHVLDFHARPAATAAGRAAAGLLSQRIPGLDEDAISFHHGWLVALVAPLASATAALVANAGSRMAKCYELAVRAPQGAAVIASAPWWQKALLHLCMALPAVTSLLWVTPLVQELLEVPDSTMRTLRVAACMLTASVGLACVRPLLQAHLHTGMVGWWTQRNAARNLQGAAAERLGNIIHVRVKFVSAILCKVAVEFVGPALLVLAWSTLLLGSWVSGLTQAQRAGRSDAAEQQSVWAAAALWEFVGGFMAWWTCACWASSSLLTVLLHRLGFLVA